MFKSLKLLLFNRLAHSSLIEGPTDIEEASWKAEHNCLEQSPGPATDVSPARNKPLLHYAIEIWSLRRSTT